MKSIRLLISAFLMIFFILENTAYSMPSRIHALIAYEASFLTGVPSEIGVFIGEPENCLLNSNDSICRGAYDEDNDRDPRSDPQNIFSWLGLFNWGTHFWNPEGGPYGGRLDYAGDIPINLEMKNAYQRARELYTQAKSLYGEDPAAAYYKLGRAAHLITDMATPAHVHLDIHISDGTQFGDESFEEYLENRYGDVLTSRTEFEYDFPNEGLFPVDYNTLSDGGNFLEPPLYRIFLSMANTARNYDSDDADGLSDNGSRRGMSVNISHDSLQKVWMRRSGYPDELLSDGYSVSPARNKLVLLNSTLETLRNTNPPYEALMLEFLNGSEIHSLAEFETTDIGDRDSAELASILIPSAIEHTAALYRLFWAETHSSFTDEFPVLSLAEGFQVLHINRPEPIELNIDFNPNDWSDDPVEVYAWLDISLGTDRMKFYFNESWLPFENYDEMRPLIDSWGLVNLSGCTWNILADTFSLPDLSFFVNLCIDRVRDGYYTPEESICDGVNVHLGNELN